MRRGLCVGAEGCRLTKGTAQTPIHTLAASILVVNHACSDSNWPWAHLALQVPDLSLHLRQVRLARLPLSQELQANEWQHVRQHYSATPRQQCKGDQATGVMQALSIMNRCHVNVASKSWYLVHHLVRAPGRQVWRTLRCSSPTSKSCVASSRSR